MGKNVKIEFKLNPMLEQVDAGEMESRITENMNSMLLFGGLGSISTLSVVIATDKK